MDFDALSKEELIRLFKSALSSNKELKSDIDSLTGKVSELERIIERLMGGSPPPVTRPKPALPAFVKPNVKRKPLEERKKRLKDLHQKNQEPTHTERHFPNTCSCCNRQLSGGWRHAIREIIELPITPVRIFHHKIKARYCGVGNRREVAFPDLLRQGRWKGKIGSLPAEHDRLPWYSLPNDRRDLHKLREVHPSHPGVSEFYEGVKKIYKSARDCVIPVNPLCRRDLRRECEAKLSALARQH